MTEPVKTEARAAVLRRTTALGATAARTMGAVQIADISLNCVRQFMTIAGEGDGIENGIVVRR